MALPLPAAAVFEQVMAAYRAPDRFYHTLQHLGECFERLDEAGATTVRPGEVEVALWFHDAVYDPHRNDNEAASAAWAATVVAGVGGARAVASRIEGLILATRHTAAPADPDQALLVDIDLAILGAPEHRFDEYQRQIRQEYRWVPEGEFRSRRRAILQGFLDRPFIYSTPPCRQRFEAPARANLQRAISRLQMS